MVGDGAGCGWNSASGWAVTVFDRHSERQEVFSGAASGNSTACAELYPYLHATIWHHRVLSRSTKTKTDRPNINIHIVTDAQSIAESGNDMARLLTDKKKLRLTRPLWAALHQFTESGYTFSFHWSRRGTFATNQAMNNLARRAMRAIRPKHESPDDGQTPPAENRPL